MVDVHCHILPHMDDGPKTKETAVRMAKLAQNNGIEAIIATPHYDPEKEEPAAFIGRRLTSYNELTGTLKNQNINIPVYSGGEIAFTPKIPKILKQLKESNADTEICLAKTRYILLELPFYNKPIWVRQTMYEMLLMGYVPVIAHLERYSWLIDMMEEIGRWVNMGVLVQVNVKSFSAERKSYIRRNLKALIKEKYIHFLASDAHDTEERKPANLNSLDFVQKKTLDMKKILQNAHDLLYNGEVII